MTTAFFRPSSISCPAASPFPQIRERRGVLFRKCCCRISFASLLPVCKAGPLRRDVVLIGCCSAMNIIFSSSVLNAVIEVDEDVKMALVVDDINAYSFLYPAEVPAKKFSFR